jgi:xanthine dehydrogenase YagT iron-sulfur-binding subunit
MASDEHDDGGEPRGVSRRDFIKGSVAGAVAAGIGGALAESAEAAAGGVAGPGPVAFNLLVNGKSHPVRLEPRVTLLEALRDTIGLTGAKRVCDRGTCGSCTVLLEGQPVYGCSVLAIEAQGRPVTTVEGIGTPGALHPVQAAFVEHDAQQCGFCTPGFVMATKALLDRVPNPSAEEVARALGGNLCRCGTYAGMRRAVDAAARGVATKGGKARG